jgi:hypothetical protein
LQRVALEEEVAAALHGCQQVMNLLGREWKEAWHTELEVAIKHLESAATVLDL